MWKIPKPNITAIDCFDTCITGIKNADLKQRFDSIRENIDAAEAEFDTAASNINLHLIAPNAGIAGVVTSKDMSQLYDRHMAREKSRGHEIYDEIMIAAPDDRLPILRSSYCFNS